MRPISPRSKPRRLNLAGISQSIARNFFWIDLLSEPVERRYDAIVMNPPFHRSRAAEPEIGAGMIRAAAKALKPGGRLFMVANRQLPYEPILSAAFSSHAETRPRRHVQGACRASLRH